MTTGKNPMAEPIPERMDESAVQIALRLEQKYGPQSDAPAPPIDEAAPPVSAPVFSLPYWAADKRGTPHAALRSALFAAIQGPKRKALHREVLETPEGLEIRFTGWQLNQSDLDVWEQLLHRAQEQPLGTQIRFVAHDLLKGLGRSTGRANHEWLKGVIARLGGCFVEITQGRWTYGGSLLEMYRDEETDRYVLELNPKLLDLFDAGWTAIDWEQRQQLRRKPLALWLHGHLASHAAPYPVSVEYLRRLSGSENEDRSGFKRNLKRALGKLEDIGAIRSFEIAKDLVSVETIPTLSQRRYLNRGKPRQI